MASDSIEIGNRLQAARKRVRPRLTQAAVAERIGVTSRTLSEWESGRSMPTAPDLASLAKLYGVAADFLLGLTDAESGLPTGRAVLDRGLLDELDRLDDGAAVRRVLDAHGWQLWFQVPSGAVVTTVEAAIAQSKPLLERWRVAPRERDSDAGE